MSNIVYEANFFVQSKFALFLPVDVIN